MDDKVTKQLLDTIDYAIDSKISNLEYDSTLPCKVVKIYPNNSKTYQLQYKNAYYTIITKNITLSLHDSVHLVIPKGNFSNKYLLEDVSLDYQEKFITNPSGADTNKIEKQIIISSAQPTSQSIGDIWYRII